MAGDPVCGMEVGKISNLVVEYGGKAYYFCSTSCQRKFEKNPERHIGASQMGHRGHQGHMGGCCGGMGGGSMMYICMGLMMFSLFRLLFR